MFVKLREYRRRGPARVAQRPSPLRASPLADSYSLSRRVVRPPSRLAPSLLRHFDRHLGCLRRRSLGRVRRPTTVRLARPCRLVAHRLGDRRHLVRSHRPMNRSRLTNRRSSRHARERRRSGALGRECAPRCLGAPSRPSSRRQVDRCRAARRRSSRSPRRRHRHPTPSRRTPRHPNPSRPTSRHPTTPI